MLIVNTTVAVGADDVVLTIREAYEEGDIDRAEFLALKALQRTEELTIQELLEVHKLLAFCYVALDDRQSAIDEFLEVLELNPKLNLDPRYVSPKIITVFDVAQQQYRDRPKDKELQPTPESISLQASMYSLVVPGWGQIKKGQPTRGYAFMTAQLVTLGSWIGLAILTNSLGEDYRSETNLARINDRYHDYKTALRWRNGVGLTALAVYAASFFDALYGPEPQVPSVVSLQHGHVSTTFLTLTISL
jgi:tetratricopeptide (TPR) repeat protein